MSRGSKLSTALLQRIDVDHSLGQIGEPARAAVPQLQAIARSNPYECTICEEQQLKDQTRYEDLRRAARAALARISGS